MVTLTIKQCIKRLNGVGEDENGAVFWYGAIIIFIALAIFGGMWDSSRFINSKITAQNSVDAAALEFSVWQARGLNVVQEVNNDVCEIDTLIETVLGAAAAAISVYNLTMSGLLMSLIGTAAGVKMLKFRDGTLAKIGNVIFGILKGIRLVTLNGIKIIRQFYLYGANILGYLGAQTVASANGASPILDEVVDKIQNYFLKEQNNSSFKAGFGRWISKTMKKFTAVGFPLDGNPFKLPLIEKKPKKGPLNKHTKGQKFLVKYMKFAWLGCEKSFDEKWMCWQDPYYSSSKKDEDTPAESHYPTWLWVARSNPKPVLIGRQLIWSSKTNSKFPRGAFAYALTQVQGGNIVCYSGDSKVRPPGMGAGIEPVLVSLEDTKWKEGVKKFLSGLLFMH